MEQLEQGYGKPTTTEMTQGNPLALLASFALPLLLSNLFQQFYSVTDSVIVGRLLGVHPFAALGAAFPCYWFVFAVILGFSQGFGILFAQRFGAKELDGLKCAAAQAVLLSAGLSVLIMVCTLPFVRPALGLLGTPAEITEDAAVYLYWMLCATPIFFFGNTAMALLRALGNSRAPLFSVILSSVVNVLLDILFLAVFGMGVRGAAIATLLAALCSLLYCLLCLSHIPQARLERAHCVYDPATVRALLRLSFPLAFQDMVINAGGLLIQAAVNGYGTLYIAGISAAHKYFGVMNLVGFALDGAVVVYVGQNYGAGQYSRIRVGVRTAVKIALVSSVAIALLTAVFGRGMISLLIADDLQAAAQVVEIGYCNLLAFTVCLPSLYLLFVYRSSLQGMGNIALPVLSGFAELALRLLSVLLLTRYIGVWGVYFADGVGWVAASLLLAVSYYTVYRRKAGVALHKNL